MTLLFLACASTERANDDPNVADTADSADTAADWAPAAGCPAAEPGRHEVESATASTYFAQHPEGVVGPANLVIFLPGGDGTKRSAEATWASFFDEDPRGYRIVMPFVGAEGDYPNVSPPVEALLDEVAACFGPAAATHLVGHSNGGYLAYNVVGPDLAARFVTITGAPGYFQQFKHNKLEGLAFHNAAGETDTQWVAGMRDAHEALTDAGFTSQLTIWPGQGHTPGRDWDGRDGMFAFWDAHPTAR